MLRQQVKDKVKTLLNVSELTPSQDLEIDVNIDILLAYCQRGELIPAMVNPVASVIVDMLNNQFMASGHAIQSYSEGDMSVSFAIDSQKVGKFAGKLESFKLIRGAVNYHAIS